MIESIVGSLLLFVFAGLAIGCAVAVVWQNNPLYSAISLIGVFIALASIYLMLAAPFIAVTQILVYAGAIMVLVVFVIMLLNVEADLPVNRVNYLWAVGGVLGLALLGQTLFIFTAVSQVTKTAKGVESTDVGLVENIGKSLFTSYLLPFEFVGILLLMAIIGAMMMARKLEPDKLEAIIEHENEVRHLND